MLATRIGSDANSLYAYAELEAPVPPGPRAKLSETLGLAHERLFAEDPPAPADFLWAVRLRRRIAEAETSAAELAQRCNLDPRRIHNWMELDDGASLVQDASGNVVKPGQVAPATRRVLTSALGCTESDIFSKERPMAGARWPVRPTLQVAIDGFGGGRPQFIVEADLDSERLTRWLDWQEPVVEETWRAINRLFGLDSDSDILFKPTQVREESVG